MRRCLGTLLILTLASLALAQMGGSSLDQAHSATDALHRFADASVIEGTWSKLIRTDHEVSAQVSTSELEPGGIYTLWWVFFNNPGACSPTMDDPTVSVCGEDDIFNADGDLDPNPLARITVLWASGGMADEDGNIYLSAVMSEGEAPGSVLFGSGVLEDARKTEVHLVVRTHSQPDLSRLYDQLSMFEMEGCDACEDVQFSVYLPQ